MTTLCAFALLVDDSSRLLLCRRKKDRLWNLPGGEVESREAPWQAAMREVREEIGVSVRVERLVGIYTVSHLDDLVLTFRCTALSNTTRASDEIDGIEWFEQDRLPADMRERHEGRARDMFVSESVVMRIE